MTREEAIKELEKGNKLRHKYFMSDEYIYMKDEVIYTEDDYVLDTFYSLDTFKDGWEIIEE
jgi:hypothetical protein